MTESIITISVVGLLAGFIFSMPVVGPISILVTTNALKGRIRYCNMVTAGASAVTFAYVFIALFGLTKLYIFYEPAIPMLLLMGAIFLLLLGYRIFRTKIDIENLEERNQSNIKIIKRERGGFYTGIIINLLNPTLFIGWLSSTFLALTFVASLGFNIGGLEESVDRSIREIGNLEINVPGNSRFVMPGDAAAKTVDKNPESSVIPDDLPSSYNLLISLSYAFFLSLGSITWFYLMSSFINHYRNHINIRILTTVIRSMGIILSLTGVYFGYLAARILIGLTTW